MFHMLEVVTVVIEKTVDSLKKSAIGNEKSAIWNFLNPGNKYCKHVGGMI